MKPSSVDNGKTNESLSGIKEQSVGEAPGSNRSSEFSVETELFGLKLLMMSKLKHFFPLISQKVSTGSTSVQIPGKLTPVSLHGDMFNHGERQYSDGKGNHINGLEGFWGYLKRKLASKGGIRQEKLPLYLGEYVWRYNHRKENDNVKMKRIIKLLEHEVSGWNDTIPV